MKCQTFKNYIGLLSVKLSPTQSVHNHVHMNIGHCFLGQTLHFKNIQVKSEPSICLTFTVRLSSITKTCLYNFDPLKPHFFIVKLWFTGVNMIFLISAQKHRLWVLLRRLVEAVLMSIHNLCFEQTYE